MSRSSIDRLLIIAIASENAPPIGSAAADRRTNTRPPHGGRQLKGKPPMIQKATKDRSVRWELCQYLDQLLQADEDLAQRRNRLLGIQDPIRRRAEEVAIAVEAAELPSRRAEFARVLDRYNRRAGRDRVEHRLA
jgi:hypothetical protein